MLSNKRPRNRRHARNGSGGGRVGRQRSGGNVDDQSVSPPILVLDGGDEPVDGDVHLVGDRASPRGDVGVVVDRDDDGADVANDDAMAVASSDGGATADETTCDAMDEDVDVAGDEEEEEEEEADDEEDDEDDGIPPPAFEKRLPLDTPASMEGTRPRRRQGPNDHGVSAEVATPSSAALSEGAETSRTTAGAPERSEGRSPGIATDAQDESTEVPHSPLPFLTFLTLPAYEKTYRAQVIKPINALVNGSTLGGTGGDEATDLAAMSVEEIWGIVREVMRGVYRSACVFYGEECNPKRGAVNKNNTTDQKEQSPSGDGKNVDFNAMPVFKDEDAELQTRRKLLPQTVRLLLKIGNIGTDRRDFFSGCNGGGFHRNGNGVHDVRPLGPEAEAYVASMLIDFVVLAARIMWLPLQRRGFAELGTPTEPGQHKEGQKAGTSVMNPLDYLGPDYLDIMALVFIHPAVYHVYLSDMRRVRDSPGAQDAFMAAATHIPRFYPAHPGGGHKMLEALHPSFMHPIFFAPAFDLGIDGDKRKWSYDMYYHTLVRTEVVGSEELRVKNPLPKRRCHVYGSLVAFANAFLVNGGLRALTQLVLAGAAQTDDECLRRQEQPRTTMEQTDGIDRARLETFQPALAIARALAYISSRPDSALSATVRRIVSKSTVEDECHITTSDAASIVGAVSECPSEAQQVAEDFDAFREAIVRFIRTVNIGVNVTTVEERQRLTTIVEGLCERSVTDDERLLMCLGAPRQQADDSAEATKMRFRRSLIHVDLPFTEADAMKMEVLWKFLSGGKGVAHSTTGDTSQGTPSMQCQILGLNELRHWIDAIEADAVERRQRWNSSPAQENRNMVFGNVTAQPVVVHDGQNSGSKQHHLRGGSGNGRDDSEALLPTVERKRQRTTVEARQADGDGNSREDAMDSDKLSVPVGDVEETEATNGQKRHRPSEDQTNGSRKARKNDSKDDENDDSATPSDDTTRPKRIPVHPSAPLPLPPAPTRPTAKSLFFQAQGRLHHVLECMSSKENPILEHLLSPGGLHPELLKRCAPLLTFLSRYGKLKKSDLKLLWEASGLGGEESSRDSTSPIPTNRDTRVGTKGAKVLLHESVTTTVVKLIAMLLHEKDGGDLNEEMLCYLTELMENVRDKRLWTPSTVNLIELIVKLSLSHRMRSGQQALTAPFVPAGFNLLWEIATDDERMPRVRGDAISAASISLLNIAAHVVRTAAGHRDDGQIDFRDSASVNVEMNVNAPATALWPLKAPDGAQHSAVRLDTHQATLQTLCACQFQTHMLERALNFIRSPSGCSPTSCVRLLLCFLRELPLGTPRSDAGPEERGSAPTLLRSVADIMGRGGLISALVDELVAFAGAQWGRSEPELVPSECRMDIPSATTLALSSKLESFQVRLDVFKLAVQRSIQLAPLATVATSVPGEFEADGERLPGRKRRHAVLVEEKDPSPAIVVEEELPVNGNSTRDSTAVRAANDVVQNEVQIQNPSERKSQALSAAHLKKLWSRIVGAEMPTKPVDATLAMLLTTLDSNGHFVCDSRFDALQANLCCQPPETNRMWLEERSELIRSTLFPLCCELDPSSIRKAGYELFVHCFGEICILNGSYLRLDFSDERRNWRREWLLFMDMSDVLLGSLASRVCASAKQEGDNQGPRKMNSFVCIANYNMIGIEKFWSFALETEDQEVSEFACNYLSILHAYPSFDGSGDPVFWRGPVAEEQRRFVRKCFCHLSGDSVRKLKVLRILRGFVETVLRVLPRVGGDANLGVTIRWSHGYDTSVSCNLRIMGDSTTRLDVSARKVIVDPGSFPRLSVVCPFGLDTLVGYIKQQVSNHIQSVSGPPYSTQGSYSGIESRDKGVQYPNDVAVAPPRIRLFFRGREIASQDSEPLSNILTDDDGIFFCTSLVDQKHPSQDVETYKNGSSEHHAWAVPIDREITTTPDEVPLFPPGVEEIISSNHLDFLFGLLPSGRSDDDTFSNRDIIRSLWELLQLLPTDPRVVFAFTGKRIQSEDFNGSQTSQWERWLPLPRKTFSENLYRLLYGLQFVETLCLRSGVGLQGHGDTPTGVGILNSFTRPPGVGGNPDPGDDNIVISTGSRTIPTAPDSAERTKQTATCVIVDDDEEDRVPGNGTEETAREKREKRDCVLHLVPSYCPGWQIRFLDQDGFVYLARLLSTIDLSSVAGGYLENIDESETFSTDSAGLSLPSRTVVLLRCTDQILNITRHIVEEGPDDMVNIDRRDEVLGGIVHHLLWLIHWSVAIQNGSRPSTESNFHTDPTSAVVRSVAVPGTALEWLTCDSAAAVARQSLQLLSSILTRMRPEAKSRSRYPTDGAKGLSLMRFLGDDAGATERDATRRGGSSVLTNAVASSLVKSSSACIRSLALETLRAVFRIGGAVFPERHLSGTVISYATHESPDLLTVLVNLLHLGCVFAPISQHNKSKTLWPCCHLFTLLTDALSNYWESLGEANKADERKAATEKMVGYSFFDAQDDKRVEELLRCVVAPDARFGQSNGFGLLLRWLVQLLYVLPHWSQASSCKSEEVGEQHGTFILRASDPFVVGLMRLSARLIDWLDCVQLRNAVGACSSNASSRSLLEILFEDWAFPYMNTTPAVHRSSRVLTSGELQGAAMTLMTSLSRRSPANLEKLVFLLLSKHHNPSCTPRMDIINDWNMEHVMKPRGAGGYVGMRNQGATCYLNSLIQQFYLIPPFRYGILSCKFSNLEDSPSPTTVPDQPNAQKSQGQDCGSMLRQLQVLFANLLFSERKDFDTMPLVSSIIGYDGIAIRTGEQQDVDEFFGLFCDRLETALKPLPQQNLLKDIFGGELSHVITCQECRHSSERIEGYYVLSLDVKGKADIGESLDLYTKGERLDGANQYFCESCKAKRDSVKRCCVKTLPNTLILHLKRFEFDLELMRKIKVNDRYEFPTELNMKPYTSEGMEAADGVASGVRPESYYEYSLTGVVVHTGTADSGHYYSLGKERHREDASREAEAGGYEVPDDSKSQWFCFNDSSVTPFDPATLPAAAFGGTCTSDRVVQQQHRIHRNDMVKPYSAYMLLYERNHIEFPSEKSQGKSSTSSTSTNQATWRPPYHIRHHDNQGLVPEFILKSICSQNERFLRDRTFFASEYNEWLLSTAQLLDGAWTKEKPELKALMGMIQALTVHLFENLIHARDGGSQIDECFAKLRSWYQNSTRACRWLLWSMIKVQRSWTETLLLRCPIPSIRRNFALLLSTIFRAMTTARERDSYYAQGVVDGEMSTADDFAASMDDLQASADNCPPETDEDEAQDADDETVIRSINDSSGRRRLLPRHKWWRSKSLLGRFVGCGLIDLLHECESHWRRFDQLFECLLAFAVCGHEEAIYLVRCGVILNLVDVFVGDKGGVSSSSLLSLASRLKRDRLVRTNKRKFRLGKQHRANFGPLLSLLMYLLRSGVVTPDSDLGSDSDSDSEGDKSEVKKFRLVGRDRVLYATTMTPQARAVVMSSHSMMELPRRDSGLVTAKNFITSLFDEEVNTPIFDCPRSLLTYLLTGEPADLPAMGLLVERVISHICNSNMEVTDLVCSVAQGFLEDRKADEFVLALHGLTALLRLNDPFVEQRNRRTMNAWVAGVNVNLKYEKETEIIIDSLTAALLKRPGGEKGLHCDVLLQRWVLDNLDLITSQWFKRSSSDALVKQSVIGLIGSVLPTDGGTTQRTHVAADIKLENLGKEEGKGKFTAGYRPSELPASRSKEKAVPARSKLGSSRSADGHEQEDLLALSEVSSPADSNLDDVLAKRRAFNVTKYEPPQGIQRRIIMVLADMFHVVRETIQSQTTSRVSGKLSMNGHVGSTLMTNGYGENSRSVDPSLFSQYFSAVRRCLSGSDEEKDVLMGAPLNMFVSLLNLLWTVDTDGRKDKRPTCDKAKGEMICLVERIVELHPEAGLELLRSEKKAGNEDISVESRGKEADGDGDDASDDGDEYIPNPLGRRAVGNGTPRRRRKKAITCVSHHERQLLEIFVTSAKNNECYNNQYMSHYYTLLLLLADRHVEFRRRLLLHQNWSWALNAFVLGQSGLDGGAIYDVLLLGSIRFARSEGYFRKSLIERLVQRGNDANDQSFLTQTRLETGSLKLLFAILDSVKDLDVSEQTPTKLFVSDRSNGLSQLSMALSKFGNRLDDEGGAGADAGVSSETILDGIILCLECLIVLLDSLGLDKVRKLMTNWPEIDDVSLLCTQLVTRSEKEWQSAIAGTGRLPSNEHLGEGSDEMSGAMRVAGSASELLKTMANIEAVAKAEAESEDMVTPRKSVS